MFLKQIGTCASLFASLDCSKFGLRRPYRHDVDTGRFKGGEHFTPAALGKMIREKASVSDDQAESSFFGSRRHRG